MVSIIMAARSLFYTGKVQGVGFRYSIKQLASGYDVSGWVRNLPDGRVEVWVQGEKAELEAMEQAVMESHLKGFVKEAEAVDREMNEKLKGFEISA